MSVFYRVLMFLFICSNANGQLNEFSDYNKLQCVSIGISDYETQRSLNFAHKDARAFAEFAAKNTFWPKEKKITLLTNENAAAGQIYAALNQSISELDSNDLFVFYFAGHGDTESTGDGVQSHLLAYDSPKNAYHQGGTLSSKELQSFIQKVVAKNANAILVIDACRAGNFDLVGSVQGIEMTHNNLRKITQSEIRILASQHNQKSQEYGALGGGRGVFSYFLEQGLSGEAELNKDGVIRMNELDFYVTSNVKKYTQQSQSPKFEVEDSDYPFSSIISLTNDENDFALETIIFNSRGVNIDNLGKCSDAYKKYNDYTKTKHPSLDTLFQYYRLCISCSEINKDEIKYNLEGLLISELHQIIKNSLSGKINFNLQNCQRGIQLIDSLLSLDSKDQSFYIETLKDSRLFLESMRVSLFEPKIGKDAVYKLKGDLLNRYLEEDKSPFIAVALAGIYSKLANSDSSIYYLKESSKMSPTWLFPRYQLLVKYRKTGNQTEAYKLLEEVFQIDTLYRNYECISCFFKEVNELLPTDTDIPFSDDYYASLLEKPLLKNEYTLIRFYQFFIHEPGTIKSYLNYFKFKRHLGHTFRDRIILLVAEVHHQKVFLSDKKVVALLQLLDELIAENNLHPYIENGIEEIDPRITKNKLFKRIFPEDIKISEFNVRDYETMRNYIIQRLQNY